MSKYYNNGYVMISRSIWDFSSDVLLPLQEPLGSEGGHAGGGPGIFRPNRQFSMALMTNLKDL